MKPDEYMNVLADLDRQYQTAGTQRQRKQIEAARRNLSAIYEAEKPKPQPKPKKNIRIPTLEIKNFLQEIRQKCMLAAVEQKGSRAADEYERGLIAGKLEAFDQIYDMTSRMIGRC